MDILFENGTIRTLERNSPDAQALLVRNGRIAAVGGRTAVEDQTGIDVRRVDLAGRTLLPAFLDAHSHFTAVANQFLQVSLEGCTSWADMQDRIRDYIRRERIPAGQWVTAQGYDHNLLSERRHPDRLCLDAAAPDNPVVICHQSGHMGVFNTAALERLGAGGSSVPIPKAGDRAEASSLEPVVSALTCALEQAAGLIPPDSLLEALMTRDTTWTPPEGVDGVSFSGGVADCIWSPPEDAFAYGDIGVLLGRAIAASSAFQRAGIVRGTETIRATVVGAGSHSTQVSGSTIFYRNVSFPLKNLPVLRLTEDEESSGDKLAAALRDKAGWFADQGGMTQIALSLRGEPNPAYGRIQDLARGIRAGMEPLLERGMFPVIAVEGDMAKVLGQTLWPLLGTEGAILCLDGISAGSGDYLDIGAPVAGGAVLPVVVKTLAFQSQGSEKQTQGGNRP